MRSLLEDLRSRQTSENDEKLAAYNRSLRECPPVSKALLAYLDKMFARKIVKPTEVTMQQELVYQAGIDKVLLHLRSQNELQEKDIRETRTK